MDNWDHIDEFARRFRLEHAADNPEFCALFAPTIDFAAALVDMIRELDAHEHEIAEKAFDKGVARAGLQRASQHLLESVIVAMSGMYAGSAMIYRLSVEATLQSTYSEAQVFSRLSWRRKADIQNRSWDMGASDYRRVLSQTKAYTLETQQLYTVYRTLSKIAHGNAQPFAQIDQHLHSLPRFDKAEARDLRDTMTVGNWSAGCLIRKRFKALFAVANLDRVARFDRAVKALKPVEQARPA